MFGPEKAVPRIPNLARPVRRYVVASQSIFQQPDLRQGGAPQPAVQRRDAKFTANLLNIQVYSYFSLKRDIA